MSKRRGAPPSAPERDRLEVMIARINDALGIEAAVTVRGDELKCSVIDNEDGGRRSAHFNGNDCVRLMEAADGGVRRSRLRSEGVVAYALREQT